MLGLLQVRDAVRQLAIAAAGDLAQGRHVVGEVGGHAGVLVHRVDEPRDGGDHAPQSAGQARDAPAAEDAQDDVKAL